MKCKQVQELMGAYLYGDLAPDEMRAVRQHTQVCDACRADVESRGRVVASLPNAAPELFDDDRMRITWGVKGAVRNAAAARSGLQFTRGSAVALAGVLLAGLAVAALVVVNTSKPPPRNQQAHQGKPPSAVVEIREEPRPLPKKDTLGTDDQAANPDGITPDSSTTSVADAVGRAARSGIATWRGHRGKPRAVPEKPAKVVNERAESEPQPETPKPEPATEGMKLPEPTDLNDAKTAQ